MTHKAKTQFVRILEPVKDIANRGKSMFLTMVVVVAWFVGLLFMFNGFERSQELKGGTLIVDQAKRTKLVYGLSAYLVISLVLLGMFVTVS